MALANPVDMFTEYNALKGGGVPTGGKWRIVSAPSFPVSLCRRCSGGSYSNISYSANAQVCGSSDLQIDFSGAQCSVGPPPYGEYVFEYFTEGACPYVGEFSISIGPGTADITFQRLPNVCYLEAYSQNPDNPSSKSGKYTLTDDNHIGTKIEIRHRVTRRNLSGCSDPLVNLVDSVATWGQKVFTTGNGFNVTPGNAIPANYMNDLLYIVHRYRISLSGWTSGYAINNVRIRSTLHGIINIDSSPLILAGNTPTHYTNFANSLRANYIGFAITQAPYNAGPQDCIFDCVYFLDGFGDPTLDIYFVCNHISNNAHWIGIDKTDFELEFTDGVNQFVTNNANNDANPWGVQFEREIVDKTNMQFMYLVANCQFYQASSGCYLQNKMKICETDFNTLYNLASSNYYGLALATPANAKILDFDDACTN